MAAEKDYHIFVLPEEMKLDLMTADQRRLYAAFKRINTPFYSQMVRIVSGVATPQGSKLAPTMGEAKR